MVEGPSSQHGGAAFDAVMVKHPDGWREETVAWFLALTLRARVKLILSNAIMFMHGGQVVDRRTALDSLRDT